MSRTIRRSAGYNKHGVLIPSYDCYWYWPYDPPEAPWRSNDPRSPEVFTAQRIANFHRDNGRGKHGIPRAYRNIFNRTDRHDQRLEILRCRRSDEWDDFVTTKQVGVKSWYW